ncbi:MAG: chemotaxis protein CheW [Xanthomonadaceae bacterium]|nr:chemotaxis protein CheW [Xanthomonadaceae bacterium]
MSAPHPDLRVLPVRGDAALADYLDALLAPPAARAPGVVAPPAAVAEAVGADAPPAPRPGARRYRICRAAGVRLALPACEIAEVAPLPALAAPPPGAPAWWAGSWSHAGLEVTVVRLAAVVAPDRAAPAAAALVRLGGGYWALACEDAGEDILLEPAEVRWRDRAGARPWLAGTALAARCAVLDVVGLTGMLATAMDRAAGADDGGAAR